jgi:hypothetical protein
MFYRGASLGGAGLNMRKMSLAALYGGLLALMLAGCTTIGAGHSTVVLATPVKPSVYSGDEFGDLIAANGRQRVVPDQGGEEGAAQRWDRYVATHPGTASSARIAVTIRDLNTTPPLDPMNIETTNAADVAKIMSDSSTTLDQKTALVRHLRDNYRRMPENYLPLVGREEWVKLPGDSAPEEVTVYHYFPKVGIDLTGELQTVASLDRFDFLAVAVSLEGAPEGVKFANFSPKLADLFDFSLGSLKQSASATASANAGQTMGSKATGTTTPGTGSTSGTEFDAGGSYGASANFTLSDELTRDLKADLDTRSAGIVDDGRVFLVELRSNDQHRIAGTYSYSVMLDIPSRVSKTFAKGATRVVSDPIASDLVAKVRLIGVVRHVDKVGMTGTFKRAPEPTNDDTFDEVILNEEIAPLWALHQPVMIETQPTLANLTVYTNEDAATFTVYSDDRDHVVLGRGKGREASLSVTQAAAIDIVFDPIVTVGDKAGVLEAPTVSHILIDQTAEKKAQIVSYYLPKTTQGGVKHGKN